LSHFKALEDYLGTYPHGTYKPSTPGGVTPQGGPPPSGGPGPEQFPSTSWPEADEGPGAYFYEDSGPEEWGECLHLRPNRGYWNLKKVGRGLFGAGDWNDVISAVRGNQVYVVKLHEHVDMQGNTLTSFAQSSLDYLGWNDRASSVETY
jgi:hypothetical protein